MMQMRFLKNPMVLKPCSDTNICHDPVYPTKAETRVARVNTTHNAKIKELYTSYYHAKMLMM